MRVKLAYGESGLELSVPDSAEIVTPRPAHPCSDPHSAVLRALRNPLGSQPLRVGVRPGARVAISVCDITRAQPRREVLGALLEELEGLVAPEEVTVLIATGTHRANTPGELRQMLGEEIAARCRVVNHVARDSSTLVALGPVGDGVPLYLNREWTEADFKITTGFVEPHFFAGFSGGPKMVVPGLAGIETVLVLHDARRVGHPKATWGVTEGNPMHDDIRAAAAHPLAKPDFSVDVLLDREQLITQVFAGELFEMHRAACAAALDAAMCRVAQPFDVVLTTNSGYPLDQNLYQAIKGMSAAAQVVVPGGTILCAAECRDGLPNHGLYADLLRAAESLEVLLAEIETREHALPDQWQVQIQALIRRKAEVLVHASGLSVAELESAHFGAAPDLEESLNEALHRAGPDARLCVLPEGPQTIPYL